MMCSGNVELNPGPTCCKKYPKCLDKTVPIKLKRCQCGYTFHSKSHRQPPSCHSGKIVNSQPVTSHIEGVTDKDPIPIVQSQPVTSHKWEKYKNKLNEKRREKYRFNPSPVKERFRQAYRSNSSPVKEQVRQAYRSNSSPVKERVRQAYCLNSSPIKAYKRERIGLIHHL